MTLPKLCVECANHRVSFWADRCARPIRDLVTGEQVPINRTCRSERREPTSDWDASHRCTPAAVFYRARG